MRIAVYCSAKDQIPEEYLALGDRLGKWIGEQGHTLVYGGATGGLMTRVSNAAKRAGAQVLGVIPQRIIASRRQTTNCDSLYLVTTMNDRKEQMKRLADCFVCLPGSYGTLDEMMDVIASGTVGEHHKPLYVLNYNGFYTALETLAEQMKALSFLPEQESYKPLFVQTLDDLFAILNKK